MTQELQGPLATVTHARLRAAQGDVAGARRILEEVLDRRPEDADARRLLGRLRPGAAGVGPAPAPRRGRRAAVAVLERWRRKLSGREGGRRGEEPMLDAVLQAIHQSVQGVRAVLLVGMDGMIVAGSPGSDTSTWEWVAASYAEVLRELTSANAEAGLDPPQELTVSGTQAVLAFRRVNEGYALLAALDAAGSGLGRVRFELRKAAVQLQPELDG